MKNKYFLLVSIMKDIEVFIMLFTGSKMICPNRIKMIKKICPKEVSILYVWIASFKAFFSKFWFTKFQIYLLEFLRYLLAVFDVIKVLILRKKRWEPIFDFLILWFFISKKPKKNRNFFLLNNKIEIKNFLIEK